ncbi:MAG: hypothetical protein HKN47_26420, partial [Pirellulaceae bacterium]|nr:hypothetical protein [Pirellulaceae bacterium]
MHDTTLTHPSESACVAVAVSGVAETPIIPTDDSSVTPTAPMTGTDKPPRRKHALVTTRIGLLFFMTAASALM